MKKKSLILIAACAVLITTSSIGSAFAYFSTYERALGGYTIHLNEKIKIPEKFQDWEKKVTIKNKDESQETVYVRVKGFSAPEDILTYVHGPEWVDGGDGWYYYQYPLKPNEESTEIDVRIEHHPVNPAKPEAFDVSVLYEATKAKFKEDGTPYADWSEVLAVTTEIGGDN